MIDVLCNVLAIIAIAFGVAGLAIVFGYLLASSDATAIERQKDDL